MANPSLSIVLPVHNGEQSLAVQITQLLDVLTDLTSNFEVLVINDGSTDHTEEVAYELAREYPQVRVTRHTTRRGSRGAVETGMAETFGDTLFILDDQAAIDSSKLHRLWELRNEDDLLLAEPQRGVQRSVLQRLIGWGIRLEDASPDGQSTGVQMIRRPATTPVKSARNARTDQPDVTREKHSAPRFTTHSRQCSLPRKSRGS